MGVNKGERNPPARRIKANALSGDMIAQLPRKSDNFRKTFNTPKFVKREIMEELSDVSETGNPYFDETEKQQGTRPITRWGTAWFQKGQEPR